MIRRALRSRIYHLKLLVEAILRVKVFRTLPRGIEPLHDLARLVAQWSPGVIFDIGANIGQSAVAYAKVLPKARILCFEPCSSTYSELVANTSKFSNIRCHHLAMSSERGTALLLVGASSVANRVAEDSRVAVADAIDHRLEEVQKDSVDGYCSQHSIAHIDYLKVDTEGGDLIVLKGAQGLIDGHRIRAIEVEVGIGVDNELHVPLDEVRAFLEPRGYFVFGFYDQVHEWKMKAPHLRRVNVVFISRQCKLKAPHGR